MALKLVTSPPGTGKTLLLIKMIFEYLREGRRVYSNIDQLKIEEVLPIPSNADWRDYPDGSVIIYDEAQEHAAFSSDNLIDFPDYIESEQQDNETVTAYNLRLRLEKKQYDREKDKYTESIKDIARGFQIHRHFGFDIILATQDQSFLNTLAKKCVGEHYHLTRPFGLKGNTLFFWRRLVSNPDSREEKKYCEWKKHINFNKSYFALYRSANAHTHKAKVPFKYIMVGIIILLLCMLPFYLISNNRALALLSGKEKSIQNTQSTDIVVDKDMPTLDDFNKQQAESLQNQLDKNQHQTQQDINQPEIKQIQVKQERQVSGCVYFNGKYHAFDEFGNPIHYKSDLCKNAIQNNDRSEYKAPKPIARNVQNVYSDEAQSMLDAETQQTVQAQRDYFNEP